LLFLLLVNVFINPEHSNFLMEINSSLSCTAIAQSLITIIPIFFCLSIRLHCIFFKTKISFLKFLTSLFEASLINLKAMINLNSSYLVNYHLYFHFILFHPDPPFLQLFISLPCLIFIILNSDAYFLR